jgi:hypothetical protein
MAKTKRHARRKPGKRFRSALSGKYEKRAAARRWPKQSVSETNQSGLMMKYFVLKPGAKSWHGQASRAALEAYENVAREQGQIQFAEDLRWWRARCSAGI